MFAQRRHVRPPPPSSPNLSWSTGRPTPGATEQETVVAELHCKLAHSVSPSIACTEEVFLFGVGPGVKVMAKPPVVGPC